MDFALVIYICIVVLSAVNLGFGIYWWICERGASTIYKIVLLLWAGILYSNSLAIYGRVNALIGDYDFLVSHIWHSRSLLLLICIAIYTGIMLFRFCHPNKECSCKEE